MRPIVSCFGSPTYELSKYLTTILKPLTDKSNHKLQYIEDFIDTIKTIQIPHDYKLVSFDVKSLFTSIPLQLALQCTETAIERYTTTVTLPAQDIMELLNLCLTSTYFQFNGKHYKQLHGTAMGSPVSVIVAEIVMQAIEERALATYRKTLPIWLRYVDDTFTTVHQDEINALHEHLNKQNPDIQFTKEIEENGKIPFLDCLVIHDNNKLRTTVYRKPTHTDRLLDQLSYNPTAHKATTVKTLTRRVNRQLSWRNETPGTRFPEKQLQRGLYSTQHSQKHWNWWDNQQTDSCHNNDYTLHQRYFWDYSTDLTVLRHPSVARKLITTLRRILTNVKGRDQPCDRQGAVYRIKCADCQATYIGETGRNLNTRLTEHKRATKNGDISNHIAEHHRLTKHKIDWDTAECVTYSTNYQQRLTLESWHTNLQQEPLKRCQNYLHFTNDS